MLSSVLSASRQYIRSELLASLYLKDNTEQTLKHVDTIIVVQDTAIIQYLIDQVTQNGNDGPLFDR
jgi:hypothetical protein